MFLGEVDNLEKLLYYKEWNNSLLLINTIRSCSKGRWMRRNGKRKDPVRNGIWPKVREARR